MFEQFFGGRSGQTLRRRTRLRLIVRADGAIVTNAHVVTARRGSRSTMRDGTTDPAKLHGIDEANDSPRVKIDARNLPALRLDLSSNLLIRKWAIAIETVRIHSRQFEPSVTAGVVSGTGRNLATQSEGSGVSVDMIQTDRASDQSRKFGGSLVNAAGEVIGVKAPLSRAAARLESASRFPSTAPGESPRTSSARRRSASWVGLQPQLQRNPRNSRTKRGGDGRISGAGLTPPRGRDSSWRRPITRSRKPGFS